MTVPPATYTLAIVGDIHDQWSAEDAQALLAIGVDLVLFVGDFGNESLATVRQVAQLPLPKAIAFGNHDAWYTATPWGRRRCPYRRPQEDWFKEQWEILSPYHLCYRSLNFETLGLSVVGGRPFSWGGPNWNLQAFYQEWFGVASAAESRDRILASLQAATHNPVIIVSHNGPYGLGDQPEDPCGKDWNPIGGDYGDQDLAEAIAAGRDLGKQVSLVAFGHMHHRLRHTQARIRRRLHQDDHGTLYLNAACVPRRITHSGKNYHQFSTVTLCGSEIRAIDALWVSATGEIHSQEPLFRASKPLRVPARGPQ
ncbi:TIGR04168 family protein [Lyngbya confervoides]|uniref:TIGR04168 family protein n=1 Tax=Lyngbya confervoides BDU141951 TaxID=1574623 RepID=A0ABD4T8L7_9CYAN|nr:TIGR04168 family protein [Lyngbya confervoides]MCM1984961.1 TIGR04168 family protein [Lyngbya confervoides BDU141951]